MFRIQCTPITPPSAHAATPDLVLPSTPASPHTLGGVRSVRGSGVTVRGLLLGLVGVPVTCFVVAWAEIVLKTLQIGYLQMPPAVIGIFLFFLLFNGLLRLLAPHLALTPQDLLVSYCMMTVAAMISSRGLMQKLIPLLVTANYFASDANDWRGLFVPHLKQWLMPFDLKGANQQDVSLRFFEKLRVGESTPWQLWIAPMLWWSVLVLFTFGAFFCMAALLRKQWVDNEKLAFPLVQLPMEMAGAGDTREGNFLQNRLTWVGFVVPFGIFLMKGASQLNPAIPDVSLELNLNDFVTTPPWNGMYYTPLKFSFALIGFLYLLPSDVVFSLWFFFLLSRAQDVVMRAFNIDMPGMPMYPTPLYRGYQAMGAYFVLTAYLLWVARPHLQKVWHTVTGRERGDDDNELLSYKGAFWGFWACFAGAVIFLCALGMNPLLAALQLFGLFFVIAFVMARSSSEAGMLMTESSFRPIDLVRLLTPLQFLGQANLTALTLSDSLLIRDQRSLLLGGFLDGLKMADGANIERRRFLWIFVPAILFSMLCAGVLQIWLPYDKGGLQLYGYVYQGNNRMGFDDYQQFMKPGAPPVSLQGGVFLGVGMLVTAFLVWGRATLATFPFHPLGYALCSSWTMIVFWFSAFVAWSAKTLILRYGGMKLYRQARPLFLGMILGEFAVAVFWTLVNALFDVPVPAFPWA